VKEAVDPVDAKVGEDQKLGNIQNLHHTTYSDITDLTSTKGFWRIHKRARARRP
jgi:hypothetical protein